MPQETYTNSAEVDFNASEQTDLKAEIPLVSVKNDTLILATSRFGESKEVTHPFSDLLYELRDAGIRASTSEWLDLHACFTHGLVTDLRDLHDVARRVLVKDVGDFACFDRVFNSMFLDTRVNRNEEAENDFSLEDRIYQLYYSGVSPKGAERRLLQEKYAELVAKRENDEALVQERSAKRNREAESKITTNPKKGQLPVVRESMHKRNLKTGKYLQGRWWENDPASYGADEGSTKESDEYNDFDDMDQEARKDLDLEDKLEIILNPTPEYKQKRAERYNNPIPKTRGFLSTEITPHSWESEDADALLTSSQVSRVLATLRTIVQEHTTVPIGKLDIEKTVKRVASKPGLPEFIYKQSTERDGPTIILFADASGSVSDFRPTVVNLIEGLKDDCNSVQVYYFFDGIRDTVFRDESLSEAVPLVQVLKNDPKSKILVYGDGILEDEISESSDDPVEPRSATEYFRDLVARFSAVAWLHPVLASTRMEYVDDYIDRHDLPSEVKQKFKDIERTIPMYDISVRGLTKCVEDLMEVY